MCIDVDMGTSTQLLKTQDNVSKWKIIQSNFSGSNTFGTMKISSRQG